MSRTNRTRRREALLARFRAGSLTRVKEVRAMIEAPAPLDSELISQLRAPLHTLKGESRMLGLASLAALVHQLEERLVEYCATQETLERVQRTIDLIRDRLNAPLIEDADAEAALQRGVAILMQSSAAAAAGDGEAQAEGETQSPTQGEGEGEGDTQGESAPQVEEARPITVPRPVSVTPLEGGFSMVRSDLVDDLCERLEVLRVSFGQVLLEDDKTHYGRATREAVIRGDKQVRAEQGSQARGNKVDDRARAARLDQLRHELAELAELAWTLRLVPVEPALETLQVHALDVAEELGKDLQARIDAGGAQLERSLLESLQHPIMHLINNAVDHGVEDRGEREAAGKPAQAKLEITARSVGPEVEFSVIDDGRGINLDQVREQAVKHGLLDAAAAELAGSEQLLPLLFEVGFSTSKQVSELSGRGVGLDAVRRAIEGLGGEVFVNSTFGRGSEFTIRVPLTISRETIVVIEIGNTLWGLPSRRVGPVVSLDEGVARHEVGGATIVVGGEHVPLLSLAGLLGADAHDGNDQVGICCVNAGRRYALSSPAVLGEFDLFRRPLGPLLAGVSPASASSVMDDGRLVLLLEPAALLGQRVRKARGEVHRAGRGTRPKVLVVDDSPIVRELLVELLTGAKLDVLTAGDGREALDVLARQTVDLVLSDVEMPNIDGFELLSRIRERDTELPVIMVTTRGSVADREKASSLGADAYLVKSDFRDQNMLEAVARFVEVKR